MVQAGQYADYPLPDEWQPLLAPLVFTALPLTEQLPAARPLPSLGGLIDAALSGLDERDSEVLWARFGAEDTLQVIGDRLGVTRERIRQIEKRAGRRLRTDRMLRTVVLGIKAAFDRAELLLLDVTDARSETVPEATPRQQWRFLVQLWELSGEQGFEVVEVTPCLHLYSAERLPTMKTVQALLEEHGFLSAAELGNLLECGEREAAHLSAAHPRLRRTAGDLYGWESWTLPQWVAAVADQLALTGQREWHFSHMARALEHVAPELFQAIPGRNIAAVLSRPDVQLFEYAGRKGYWRLRDHGDGHADNRAAILSVLDAADMPLHIAVVQRHLQPGRTIAIGTVHALLDRDPAFGSYGGGVYGPSGRALPHFPEEDWMERLFRENGTGTLPAEQVHWAASTAGYLPERLEAIGRFSLVYRRWKHHQAEMQYLTPEAARLKNFRSWYEHRQERRQCPPLPVLLSGLHAAHVRQDRAMLLEVLRSLVEAGEPVPPQARPWMQWALTPEGSS